MFHIRELQEYLNLCGIPTNTQWSNMPDHVLLMTICFGRYCDHHEDITNIIIYILKHILLWCISSCTKYF